MSAPAPPDAAPSSTRTALASGYVGCAICGHAAKLGDGGPCRRCGAAMPTAGRRSLSAVWAWLAAGIILYIPANLYPMLISTRFGFDSPSTIVGGVIELAEYGSYFVAGVVFFASVVIPMAKFIAIGRLAYAVSAGRIDDPHRALKLYDVVEFIGRWSMIDVFVVAILSALVQIGFLAKLSPGPAVAYFALSVAFTMLSARAFDPRLIWDRIGDRP